ncbi:calcium-binding protein [Massilia sp. CCM 9029]|nr:calcium-binding protein [Massilia sp. CCM 9029]MDQ1831980.1 calcium-binding protein [Massilia sp. CCM 9029]
MAGSTDQLTVNNFLWQPTTPNLVNPLQQIKFFDGISWDLARINAELLADATPGTTITAPVDMSAPEGDVVLVAQAGLQGW